MPEDVGHAPWHQEGSQPPLYYLLAAALTAPIPTDNAAAVIRYNPHAAVGQADSFGNRNVMVHAEEHAWPWRGVSLAAHVARFFSVLLGALTVLFTYLSGRRLFPVWPCVALLAATLVAFNPQFIFISAAVNNDNLVTALSAAGLLVLSDMLAGPNPADPNGGRSLPTLAHLVLLGALAGLAALSKLSGLLLSVLIGIGLIFAALRARRPGRIIVWGAVTGSIALLVAGWWYLHNYLVFGDPLLLSAMFAILPQRPEPPVLSELIARAEGVWRSFWAVFGWFNIVVDAWVYRLFTTITLVGLLGLIAGAPLQRYYRRRYGAGAPPADRWIRLGLPLLWVVMILLLLLRWATLRYPQGRLLFPRAERLCSAHRLRLGELAAVAPAPLAGMRRAGGTAAACPLRASALDCANVRATSRHRWPSNPHAGGVWQSDSPYRVRAKRRRDAQRRYARGVARLAGPAATGPRL